MNKMGNEKKTPSTSKTGEKRPKPQVEGPRVSVEHPHNEHEVFLQTFQKPTVIYRWMAVRQKVSPVYLTRNLTYMQNKESKPKRSRSNFDLNKLAELVKPKPVTVDNVPSFVTLTYIKSSEVAELFAPNSSCMMEVVISKKDPSTQNYSFDCVAQFELGLKDTAPHTTAFNIKSDLVCGNPHFRSVIFCLTNPHAKGTKSTFVTEVKCSQSAFVDFFSDGQYDLILKEHKKFELNEFVKMTDGVNTKWVNELPDLQADLEAFVAVKFQVTWQNEPMEAEVPEVKPIPAYEEKAEPSKPQTYKSVTSVIKEESKSFSENGQSTSPKTKLSRSFVNGAKEESKPITEIGENTKSVLLKFKNRDLVRQMAKLSPELDCPWCGVKCGSTLKLLTHFELVHPRFQCTLRDTKYFHEIEISISDLYDGSFHGNPHAQLSRQFSKPKSIPIQRHPTTSILVWRPNPSERTLESFSEMGAASLLERPIVNVERLYHNSKTNIPFSVKALESDTFDDEPDSDWLIDQMCKMIDDFTDVNPGEKVMMKLWNIHMHKHNFIGDIQLPIAISTFIDENIDQLRHIYRNFILHLAHLHNLKCISTVDFAAAIIHVQKKMVERKRAEDKERGEEKGLVEEKEVCEEQGQVEEQEQGQPDAKKPRLSDSGERKSFSGILK